MGLRCSSPCNVSGWWYCSRQEDEDEDEEEEDEEDDEKPGMCRGDFDCQMVDAGTPPKLQVM